MAEQGKIERRTAVGDRRNADMDRRQFIDIGWMMDDERRVAKVDRRADMEDRRE